MTSSLNISAHLSCSSSSLLGPFFFFYITQVPIELNAAQALGIEVLCTFQMVFTVFSVEDQRRRDCPEPGNLAIGLAHTAGVLIGVSLAFIQIYVTSMQM